MNVYDPSSTFSSFSYYDRELKGEGGEELDEEHSSGAMTTTTNNAVGKPKVKTDMSKTLISERRRRGRMKEKLYALRSLVPNITKVRFPHQLIKSFLDKFLHEHLQKKKIR